MRSLTNPTCSEYALLHARRVAKAHWGRSYQLEAKRRSSSMRQLTIGLVVLAGTLHSTLALAQNRLTGRASAFVVNEVIDSEKVETHVDLSYDQTLRVRPNAQLRNWYVQSRFLANGRLEHRQTDEWSIDLRQLSLEGSTGPAAFKLGLQEIVWGETLILPVTDVLQPVDPDVNVFLETDLIRKPQPSAFLLLTFGEQSLEGIVIPVPQPPALPLPALKQRVRTIRDAEGGVRLNLRIDALDFKLLVANTESRDPLFEDKLTRKKVVASKLEEFIEQSVTSRTPFDLAEKKSRTQSYGFNTSFAWENMVLRSDAIYQLTQPTADSKKSTARLAFVAGLDLALERGNWALQYEVDNTEGKPLKSWAISQLRYPLGDFEPELLALKGIDNDDLWVKTAGRYLLSDKWSTEVAWHEIRGDGKGFAPAFTDQSLVTVGLDFNF